MLEVIFPAISLAGLIFGWEFYRFRHPVIGLLMGMAGTAGIIHYLMN